jgi:L-ascorbate metabolism protein UlaG (beta-lactamase superfamily)
MRQRFCNTDPRPLRSMTLTQVVSVAWRKTYDSRNRLPLETLPEVRPDWDALLAGGFRFMWCGHSSLVLRIDNLTVLLDPVLSSTASPVSWLVPRFQPAVVTPDELPPVDVVVISHDHYDHLDRAVICSLASRQRTRFIVPSSVGERLRGWGVAADRITELGWDEFVQVSTVRFTATEARHASRRGVFDGSSTLWVSWALHGVTASVFYTGDSGYGEHWRRIGDAYGPFDVVFAENGQYGECWPGEHMLPVQTVAAVRDVRGARFVPVHWGMFDLALHHWSEPVRRSSVEADRWGVPMITPLLGQVTKLDTATYRWWEDVDARDPRLTLRADIPAALQPTAVRQHALQADLAAMQSH